MARRGFGLQMHVRLPCPRNLPDRSERSMCGKKGHFRGLNCRTGMNFLEREAFSLGGTACRRSNNWVSTSSEWLKTEPFCCQSIEACFVGAPGGPLAQPTHSLHGVYCLPD